MRSIAVWVSSPYQGDRLFDRDAPVNRDNCLEAFHLLKEGVEKAGRECHTHDVFKSRGLAPDVALFLDIPARPVRELLAGLAWNARPWVLLQECPVVSGRNWDRSLHGQFDRLFTWDDSLVDGRRYFKLYLTSPFSPPPQPAAKKKKLCVMIAGNKKSSHPLELYSEREKTVRWFEENRPGDLDLYGVGWDHFAFGGPRVLRALNRVKPLTRLLAPDRPLYRGPVERKLPVLSGYRFSICYENAKDVQGWITEKLFDSFAAGCVPVYWGPSDIERHVPAGCFVDRRRFKTHEELYEFLAGMSEAEYDRMLAAIRDFVSSDRAYPFSSRCFADTLLRSLADD